jgi:hypothetical protein
VQPWVSPARLELQRNHYTPHARRYSPAMSESIRRTTDQLVEAGVLRRLGSIGSPFQAYAVAHAVVAAKKAAPDAPLLSRYRLAWDYRDANAKARRMPVCAPHVDDVVQFFAGATFLASLDLYSAFFSVPMEQYPPEDGLRVLLVTDRAVFETCARAWARSTAAPPSTRT